MQLYSENRDIGEEWIDRRERWGRRANIYLTTRQSRNRSGQAELIILSKACRGVKA